LNNIKFIKGDARDIPLPDSSVDIVTGITLAIYPLDGYRDFVREAARVTLAGGMILMINITPGWYGGELAHVIANEIETDTLQDKIRLYPK
jgi:ubiquinone/menaquinone biosynthesis C-methylase UbiE